MEEGREQETKPQELVPTGASRCHSTEMCKRHHWIRVGCGSREEGRGKLRNKWQPQEKMKYIGETQLICWSQETFKTRTLHHLPFMSLSLNPGITHFSSLISDYENTIFPILLPMKGGGSFSFQVKHLTKEAL